jgi:hypothetical protein
MPTTTQCSVLGGSRVTTFNADGHGKPKRMTLRIAHGYGVNLLAISCPTSSLCVVVGQGYTQNTRDAEWTIDPRTSRVLASTPIQASTADGSSHSEPDVSCFSARQCTIVDPGGYYRGAPYQSTEETLVSTFNPRTPKPTQWAPFTTQTDLGTGISCPTSSLCVALGGLSYSASVPSFTPAQVIAFRPNNPNAYKLVKIRAGQAVPVPDRFTPNAIDCPGADQCTITGNGGGSALTIDPTSPGRQKLVRNILGAPFSCPSLHPVRHNRWVRTASPRVQSAGAPERAPTKLGTHSRERNARLHGDRLPHDHAMHGVQCVRLGRHLQPARLLLQLQDAQVPRHVGVPGVSRALIWSSSPAQDVADASSVWGDGNSRRRWCDLEGPSINLKGTPWDSSIDITTPI